MPEAGPVSVEGLRCNEGHKPEHKTVLEGAAQDEALILVLIMIVSIFLRKGLVSIPGRVQ